MSNFLDQLRDLDTSEPGRWPLAIRAGVVALVFVLAAAGMTWYFAWTEKKDELRAARDKEQELKSTLESKARKAANLDEYKAQLKEMEVSFGAMLRKLPDKTEVPNLLTDISQQGSGAGLDQKLFQPGGQVNRDFYAELPIKMRLTGSYHSIGAFVSGIAALPRIVTLHDVTITPASKEAGADFLQLDVTAKTYRYLDEEEQAAAQPAAPTNRKRKNNKKK